MDNIVANNIELARTRLKNKKVLATFGTLKKKVIEPGLCIQCGKCVALCDVIEWDREREVPRLAGKCIACGLCYYQCPQSFGSPLGEFESAHVTRSLLDGVQGQDGGTVTSILIALLEAKKIDAAILTRRDPEDPWHPLPFVATSKDDILSASGTIYSNSPIIPVLLDAVNDGHRNIAIVGTSCKIKAVQSLEEQEDGLLQNIDGLKILKIGLFCSESFDPDKFLAFIETKVNKNDITKMRISNGMLWVHTSTGKESFGLTSSAQELESCTNKACFNCHDFSAENADISVGNVGTDSKHNLVLVRSIAGKEMLDVAVERGYIESDVASKENLKPAMELAWLKKERGLVKHEKEPKPGRFMEHEPESWNIDGYNYTPEVHPELYKMKEHVSRIVNEVHGGPSVLVAKIPDTEDKSEITTYNYSTAYDLTYKLLEKYPKIKGGKVFIKPNNTGFVGIFKHNEKLKPILEKNGITDDADHQPLATQPATLQGIVDAMIDLGARKIHVGENMLWAGGTQRAFYETGYCDIFSAPKYKGKVFFVDFYEGDPPPSEFVKLKVKKGEYDITNNYTHFYPVKGFFNEKYDLVFIASIAKVHNCSYYSLITKNFSVSLNPRKKSGKIEPRWHIHGLPIEVFKKDYLKQLFGADFKRKYQYLLRETYPHKWNASIKDRIVKTKKSKVILSGRATTSIARSIPSTFHSSGLIAWFKSNGKWVLNVDPHHWAGINLLTLNLGMAYLITRYTGMYAAMVDALKENGTDVAGLVTGIVGQEGDGPLIYGNVKHGGFAVAGFDAAAVEKISLDIMFGNEGGFKKAIVSYQKQLMEKYGIDNKELLDEAEQMWTLKLLASLTGGVIENKKMNITLLDYTGNDDYSSLDPEDIYKLRCCSPFNFSEAFYCSPDTWLKIVHLDDAIFRNAFKYTLKSIEIPLIPDVVD
ncbi:MAG: Coenzyme F420 hydrogenase/dehydrogenase, beta subunit C-terminal domain [Promethearchaeota archaeon]